VVKPFGGHGFAPEHTGGTYSTSVASQVHLRQCDSFGQLKRLLKTHLFGVWDRGAL